MHDLAFLGSPFGRSPKTYPLCHRISPSLHLRQVVTSPVSPPHSKVTSVALSSRISLPTLLNFYLSSRPSQLQRLHPTTHGSILRLHNPGNHISDAFIFPFGVIVVFGSDEDVKLFIAATLKHVHHPSVVPRSESMRYCYGRIHTVRNHVITLLGDGELERLAVACALAQSAKLSVVEDSFRKTIRSATRLPKELAMTGEVGASKKEIMQLMGRLYLERLEYQVSGDVLDTPSFFWENEKYLPLYEQIVTYVGLRRRAEALDEKIEVVQELYSFLVEELDSRKTEILEVAITLMIAFEILLTLLTWAREGVSRVLCAFAWGLAITVFVWALWKIWKDRRTRRRRKWTKGDKRERERNDIWWSLD